MQWYLDEYKILWFHVELITDVNVMYVENTTWTKWNIIGMRDKSLTVEGWKTYSAPVDTLSS